MQNYGFSIIPEIATFYQIRYNEFERKCKFYTFAFRHQKNFSDRSTFLKY